MAMVISILSEILFVMVLVLVRTVVVIIVIVMAAVMPMVRAILALPSLFIRRPTPSLSHRRRGRNDGRQNVLAEMASMAVSRHAYIIRHSQ